MRLNQLCGVVGLLALLAGCGSPARRPDPPAPTAAPETTFAGRWQTTFGVLTLTLDGSRASGAYSLGALFGKVESSLA